MRCEWICDVCGMKFTKEVDLLAHQFNSPCERELQKREQAAQLAQLQAIATAARELADCHQPKYSLGKKIVWNDDGLVAQWVPNDCRRDMALDQLAAALAALEQETK